MSLQSYRPWRRVQNSLSLFGGAKKLLDMDNIQQIQLDKDPKIGVIWISKAYRTGRFLELVRMFYKLIGKENVFLSQQQQQIDNSFDDLQYPGGCYVTFATKEQARQVLQEMKGEVKVAEQPRKAFLVQGRPFIEDLSKSHPSYKLNVELLDAAKTTSRLSQELLFNDMRVYGKMQEIAVDAKKENATVIFSSRSAAIAARNCLHYKTIGDAKLYIRYEPYSYWTQFKAAMQNPKILIPFLGIGITASVYLLVEPARTASVTQHVTLGHRDVENELLERVERAPVRQETYNQLKKHLRSSPSGVTVITGPSGSGKSVLVRRLLNKRAFSVVIDCRGKKSVQDFIEQFGDAIGFSPSFNALNNMLNWVESFIPGIKKTALSPSTHFQVQSMLKSLTRVLYFISASYPSDKSKEADFAVVTFDGFHEFLETLEMQSKEERDKAHILVDILMGWAAKSSNNAHIVFIGENPFGEELLLQNPYMRRAKIYSYKIKDLDATEIKKYIHSQAERQLSESEVEYAADRIGGRVSYLESFISRVNSGLDVSVAVNDMLSEAEQKVRQEGFGNKLSTTTTKWTQVQLWKTIKLLVEREYVPYDELLFKIFAGDNEALKSLIEDNLLGISKDKGERLVSSPSTLFHSAFKNMLSNPKLRLMLDIQEKKVDLNKDLDETQKIEDELTKLQRAESEKINDAMIAIVKRREALQLRLAELTPKVSQKEKDIRDLEAKLKS